MAPDPPTLADPPTPVRRRVEFAPPNLTDDDVAEVVAALRSGILTSGPRVARLEQAMADLVGAPEALALSSCTAGLHVALTAAGIGPGDAVVTTPLTFAATAHAIVNTGAKPLLADVEPDTLALSAQSLDDLLHGPDGTRIRAVLPVHLAGHAADMVALDEVALAHDLLVVEDAAHALPSTAPASDGGTRTIGGPRSGGPRALTSFSFYANKNVTTGEGGLLTGCPELLARARELAYQGRGPTRPDQPGWERPIRSVGFKYNLADPAAALALGQLKRLPRSHARRSAIAARYRRRLADVDGLELPTVRPGFGHAWHLFIVRLPLDRLRVDRRRIAAELGARGVPTSVHFVPIHHQPAYASGFGFDRERLPVTEREFPRLLSLPAHPGLSDDDVDFVADTLRQVLEHWQR